MTGVQLTTCCRRGIAAPMDTRANQPSQIATGRLRRVFILIAAESAIIAIGFVDYLTGPEIGFSLFYIPPIVVAAWFYGRREAVLLALTAAAACWFVADYLIGVPLLLSLWNGLTRLVIYISLGILIAMLAEDRRREALLARTDSITGLANSRAFREALTVAVQQRRTVCVMYLDLDNFKQVNDGYGHQRGDEVLGEVAAALRNGVKAGDVAARVGGDEFAVVFGEIELTDVGAIAQRISRDIDVVAGTVPDAGLSASLGFAVSHGDSPVEDVVQAADAAMYEAKTQKKGSFLVRAVD